MKINLKRGFLALSVFVLASCGGGGGDAGDPILGGGDGGSAATADLLMTVSNAQLSNTTSSTVVVSVTAIDKDRNAIADVPVTFKIDNDGVVSRNEEVTDEDGVITADVSAGEKRSNRVMVVTATSGDITREISVQVTGARITATLLPAVVPPSTKGEIQYRLVDVAGSPMAGEAVTIAAAGFEPADATGTTGPNGEFAFKYTSSPATAGEHEVNALIGGAADSQTIVVQAEPGAVPPVTATVLAANVDANPSNVPVNVSGSTTNRTEVRALFVTSGNKPIANMRVRFDLNGDPKNIGGFMTTGNQILYTDANGIATSAYVSGQRTTSEGVTVRACYGKFDTDPNLTNCTTNVKTTVTVTEATVSISIGESEFIIDEDDELVYRKQFLVSVVDAANVGQQDVPLSVSVDLPRYRKGHYEKGSEAWIQVRNFACRNEDLNRNQIAEDGEDIDNDSPPRLDPGKSDVLVRMIDAKSRADGTAVLELYYAKSFATWVDAVITVRAGVTGTEGSATYAVSPVPTSAADINNTDASPAFVLSPYGDAADCTNPN